MTNNVIYAIVDEPFCLWEQDTREAAISFLKSIDHGYFDYVVQRSTPDLADPENGMRAAASLRLALFHGTETLFLLIGALLQGEACPHAWVAGCSTTQLRTLLQRIDAEGDVLDLNRRIRKLSWLNIARETLHGYPAHPVLEEAATSFAKLWELLGFNHTEQISVDEYNSLKHGFRVAHGGFSVSFGPAQGIDDPAKAKMTTLGTSKWGSGFRVIRKFDGPISGGQSRQSFMCATNWDAQAVSAALSLVAVSIRNVLARLNVYHGATESRIHLATAESFEAAFKRIDLQSMSIGMWRHAEPTTRPQLILQLKRTKVRRLVRLLKHITAVREVSIATLSRTGHC